MAKEKKPFNPFYVALVLIGILFAVTASGYFVMTLNLAESNPTLEDTAEETSGEGLLVFLDRHGFTTMMIELGCLAVVTVGAMLLDEYRDRRKPPAPIPANEDNER